MISGHTSIENSRTASIVVTLTLSCLGMIQLYNDIIEYITAS